MVAGLTTGELLHVHVKSGALTVVLALFAERPVVSSETVLSAVWGTEEQGLPFAGWTPVPLGFVCGGGHPLRRLGASLAWPLCWKP